MSQEERLGCLDTVGTQQDPSSRLRSAVVEVTPQVRQVLSRYNIPFEDGEDLLQDSVLVVLERLHKGGAPILEPAGYLIGVLRRRCLMYWRERRSRQELPLDEMEEPGEKPGQRQVEHRQELRILLSLLKSRQRRMLFLRLYLGYSSQEVATRLGVAQSTVRKGMHRTRRKLRSEEK